VPLIHILLAWRLVDNAAKGDLLCPQSVDQVLPVAWQANGKLAQDAVKAGAGEPIKAAKALDLLGQGVGLPPIDARQGELGVKGVHCVHVVLALHSACSFNFTPEFERNRYSGFAPLCQGPASALPRFAKGLPKARKRFAPLCQGPAGALPCFASATYIQFPK
jgi:hypothetical protein